MEDIRPQQFRKRRKKQGTYSVVSVCVDGTRPLVACSIAYTESTQRPSPPALPLTPESVEIVFSAGDLTKRKLGEELGIPSEHLKDPSSAADWWVKNGADRRWRRIIYELDRLGKTEIADVLMPCSEPPPGAWGVPIVLIKCVMSLHEGIKAPSRTTRVIVTGSKLLLLISITMMSAKLLRTHASDYWWHALRQGQQCRVSVSAHARTWSLSPESIRILECFQEEIAKTILELPKWYSNTAASMALCWISLHSICTIKK